MHLGSQVDRGHTAPAQDLVNLEIPRGGLTKERFHLVRRRKGKRPVDRGLGVCVQHLRPARVAEHRVVRHDGLALGTGGRHEIHRMVTGPWSGT